VKNTVEVASCDMIYILSFIKIGVGVQAILRFCLSDLRGCIVGIADERVIHRVTTHFRKEQLTRNKISYP
jgi:hypothetical protein